MNNLLQRFGSSFRLAAMVGSRSDVDNRVLGRGGWTSRMIRIISLKPAAQLFLGKGWASRQKLVEQDTRR